MKKQHLMTITESQYGADRDLDGPLEPKYQAMMDRINAKWAASQTAKAQAAAAYSAGAAGLAAEGFTAHV